MLPFTAGGRLEQRLPDTTPGKGKQSLGVFQFTGPLPLDLDFTFVSGVVDPGEVCHDDCWVFDCVVYIRRWCVHTMVVCTLIYIGLCVPC